MKHATRLVVPLLASLALAWGACANAASHREAPLIAMDPAADNTDVYAFVSYDAANLARAPADRARHVHPERQSGPGSRPTRPNYFNFDDDVLYTINIDNNRDGAPNDVVYEFRFTTAEPADRRTGRIDVARARISATRTSPAWAACCRGITALDGPGSEGLTRRQTYTVTEVRGAVRTPLFTGTTLVAVPSNAGPATIPNYPALAAQGIYTDAGDRRPRVRGPARRNVLHRSRRGLRHAEPAPLPAAADRARRGRRQRQSVRRSTASAAPTSAPSPSRSRSRASPATACPRPRRRTRSSACMRARRGSRMRVLRQGRRNRRTVRADIADGQSAGQRAHHQHAGQGRLERRPIPRTRRGSRRPTRTRCIATALQLVYGVPIVPINGSPASNRTDLMSILLKYPGQALSGSDCGNPCSELLRLDLRVAADGAGEPEVASARR